MQQHLPRSTEENLVLKTLCKKFNAGALIIHENPIRQVGGKKNAPHLKTTAYHFDALDVDWINTESSFEADFVLVTALNPSVTAIYHQRATLTLSNGSTYTPDFLVIKNGRPTIVEVKPHKFNLKAPWPQLFEQAQSICEALNVTFEVQTERQFRVGNLHKRAEYIAFCARLEFNSEDILLAIEEISKYTDGMTFDFFMKMTGLPKILVLKLVANRHLYLNSALEYEDDSMIYSSPAY